MRQKVLKLMSAICIATGITAMGSIPVSAANYYYDGDIMEMQAGISLTLSASQWYQRANGTWGATDGHQGLVDMWVYYNNKWYFIDKDGNMVENAVVWAQDGNMYYMQEDGSMLTNGYGSYLFYGNRKVGADPTRFYADANGVLTIIK